MGRELRKVPSNWEHPKRGDGKYQPMLNKYYGDALTEWIENHNQWELGTHPDLVRDPSLKTDYPFFAMWDGNAPDVDYCQTKKYKDEELTHIQLYENISEGTPVSPVFKAEELEKLCEYASENCTTFASFKATKEEWIQMLGDDFVRHTSGNVTFM